MFKILNVELWVLIVWNYFTFQLSTYWLILPTEVNWLLRGINPGFHKVPVQFDSFKTRPAFFAGLQLVCIGLNTKVNPVKFSFAIGTAWTYSEAILVPLPQVGE